MWSTRDRKSALVFGGYTLVTTDGSIVSDCYTIVGFKLTSFDAEKS